MNIYIPMDAIRKIIHCDCDCFYAAVEIRDQPALRDRPVAVGGSAEQRGVIATCNYIARQYGIRSAMATAQALQRCPGLILLKPNMEKYRAISQQILGIYQTYTHLIEPISLDEAYLDVTAVTEHQGSGTLMAQALRKAVFKEVGLTVSAGIAPNKFLAKIASDWEKPDGCFTLSPNQVPSFVAQLPVNRIPGVGPVTAEKLKRLKVKACADLQDWSKGELVAQFGQFGLVLFDRCRGIDLRPVVPIRQRKSVSVEETYAHDLDAQMDCHQAIEALIRRLHQRVDRAQAYPHIHKQFVKIRFNDFRSTTMECLSHDLSPSVFLALFNTAYQRHPKPIRLLGVGVRLSTATASDDQDDLFSSARLPA